MDERLGDRLWNFALDVYGAEGVSAECLYVQERFGADVCLVLTAAFVAATGHDLSRTTLVQWDDAVREWRDATVRPLRAVRTNLKPMLDGPEIAQVRDAVLAAELQAERLQLRRLAELVERTAPPVAAEQDADKRIAVAIARAAGLSSSQHVVMPALANASRNWAK